MYPNINENYFLVSKFWYVTFVDLLVDFNAIDQWQMPYFKTYEEDGTYFLDGNPIFSMYSERDNKIIKVIQEKTEREYTSYVSKFGDEIPMLSCVLYLNDESLSLLKVDCAQFIK